jgi:hypothetical protein
VTIGILSTVVLQLQPYRARPVKLPLQVGSRRGQQGRVQQSNILMAGLVLELLAVRTSHHTLRARQSHTCASRDGEFPCSITGKQCRDTSPCLGVQRTS